MDEFLQVRRLHLFLWTYLTTLLYLET
jgi:hypothetical protein